MRFCGWAQMGWQKYLVVNFAQHPRHSLSVCNCDLYASSPLFGQLRCHALAIAIVVTHREIMVVRAQENGQLMCDLKALLEQLFQTFVLAHLIRIAQAVMAIKELSLDIIN